MVRREFDVGCTTAKGLLTARFLAAIAICRDARRAGGVQGGEAAERSEGILDAAEHRALLEERWPARDHSDAGLSD